MHGQPQQRFDPVLGHGVALTLPTSDKNKYQVIEAESEKLRQYVDSRAECILLLNQGLAFDLEYVLLLVGNDHNITSGTWVRFSNELKFCYDKLLQEIY